MEADTVQERHTRAPTGRAAEICVLLASSHRVVRHALRRMVEAEHDLAVLEVATGREALDTLAVESGIDVLVADEHLSDLSAFELCRLAAARHSDVPCLILDWDGSHGGPFGRHGVAGIVSNLTAPHDMLVAIHAAARGEPVAWAAPEQAPGRDAPAVVDNPYGLTDQERRVAALVAEGLTNQQIAERLFLAEPTVRNYVSRILAKTALDNRTQLARLMLRQRRTDKHG